MSKIQGIRGFTDIFGPSASVWDDLECSLTTLANQYNYTPIRLPFLEKSELFQRSVGVTSDIVHKEMYSFIDKNDASVSLRPEGTAGCVRVCIEHNLLYGSNQKFFYIAPMFRRERPQKGRLRQFHQFGIEAYGFPEGSIEIEQQLLLSRIWQTLSAPHPTLHINYLGCHETRQRYKDALQDFYKPYAAEFDALNKNRLVSNPLRLLDSKDPNIIAINHDAPHITSYLTTDEQNQYRQIRDGLTLHNIAFVENPTLVRGLDYYSGFIYEYTSDLLGAQSSVCGGGRYDQLFTQLGGQPISATGFSIGLERLLAMMNTETQEPAQPSLVWINLNSDAVSASLGFCEKLRSNCPELRVDCSYIEGKASNQLKKAEKHNASYAILCGEDELQSGTFTFKNLKTRSQENLSLNAIINKLNKE